MNVVNQKAFAQAAKPRSRASARRKLNGDAARTPVLHLTMPGHETARAYPLANETIGGFLKRNGWADRQKIKGKARWCFRLPTICTINGEPVLQREWQRRRIKDGDHVAFVSRPLGGRQGAGKSALGLVATIALAAFAPWAGGAIAGALGLGQLAAYGITAAIAIGGSLLINSLFSPKPGGQNDGSSTDQVDQIYTASANGNVARLLQTIPVQYGRVKDFPDFAATPWSEFDGNDQYLNLLLCQGLGKYQLHNIFIDDTILWDESTGTNSAFDGVEFEAYGPGEDVTLFPINVVQAAEVNGQQLPNPSGIGDGWIGGFIVNAAGTEADAIAVDIVFPSGCFTINQEDGSLGASSVTLECQYRRVDNAGAPITAYDSLFSRTFTFATRNPTRTSVKTEIPAGRFEVRLRRTSAPLSGTNGSNEVAWAGVRAFIEGPSSFEGVSVIAIRMKATAQLTEQTSRRFGILQTKILPVWDTEYQAFVEQPTRNPIWAFYDAATNTDYGAKRPPSKIDFQAVADAAAAADARGDTFDYIFRSSVPVPDAFDTILKCSRSRHRWSGDILTLVRDEWRSVPQMLLTDREIRRGSLKIEWALNTDDAADAVIVEYVDEDTWKVAEVQYPSDGLEFTSESAARVRMDGICKRETAYKFAGFFYLQSIYRRIQVTLDTEHDGRLLGYGAAVRVQSDLPESWGETGAIEDSDGTTLYADHDLTWASSGQHYIAIRTKTGAQFGPVKCERGSADDEIELDADDLQAVETDQSMTLAKALERDDGADLPSFDFGVGTRRARNCIVVSGRPSGDHVTLTLAVDDERVHEADLGGVPPAPTVPTLVDPSAPTVLYLAAHFRQGQLEPLLDASWWPAAGAQYYVAQVSYDNGASWNFVYEGTGTTFSAVVDRAALRLRVQAVGQRAGAFTTIDVAAPEIALAPNTVPPAALQPGLRDYVLNQLKDTTQKVNFALQQIAALAGDQDADNYLSRRETRRIIDAQAGGVRAVIEETAQVVETMDGRLAAAWFLTINNDGYVSGIYQYNDGQEADFVVVADNFIVAAPGQAGGDPVTIFQIAEVNGEAKIAFKGDMFADGSITADKINVNELSAITANIGEVTAGIVRDNLSNMIINLDEGRIEVFDDD